MQKQKMGQPSYNTDDYARQHKACTTMTHVTSAASANVAVRELMTCVCVSVFACACNSVLCVVLCMVRVRACACVCVRVRACACV